MFFVLLIVFASVSVVLSADVPEHYDPSKYLCSMCIKSVEFLQEAQRSSGSLLEGCNLQYDKVYCELFFGQTDYTFNNLQNNVMTPRNMCEKQELCVNAEDEVWFQYSKHNHANTKATSSQNIRVSKAMGREAYNKVRVSIISNSSIPLGSFSYSEQFKYKWTNFYLASGYFEVNPGTVTTLQLTADASVDVYIPAENQPTRGVIISDPCFSSQWISCAYATRFNSFNQSVELLNAIHLHEDNHFWQILGDNFYDVR